MVSLTGSHLYFSYALAIPSLDSPLAIRLVAASKSLSSASHNLGYHSYFDYFENTCNHV